jgi:chemotaxis protein MotB
MRTHAASTLLAVLLCAGCCSQQEETIKQKETRISELESKNKELEASVEDHDVLSREVDNLKSKLNTQQEILDEMAAREAQSQKRLDLLRDMMSKFKGMIDAGQLSVHVQQGKMKLELPSEVLFPSGSAELSDKGKETLDEVAKVLKEIKGREFQVAGHTDSKKITKPGEFETNWHLSAARAVSVVIYLQDKGIKPRQLSAAGYSQYHPVASNAKKSGQAQNRRIEITLLPNLDELPDLTELARELGLESRDEVIEEEGEASE